MFSDFPPQSSKLPLPEFSSVTCAGTHSRKPLDSLITPGVPLPPVHGENLHEELTLLEEAPTVEIKALRSATIEAAAGFKFDDRKQLCSGNGQC